MKKEELEKEAEEWIGRNKPVQDDWEDSDIIQAIVDTNEKREKRIAELEAQIEQLAYLHKEDVNTIKLLNKQIKEIKENV